MMTNLLQDLRYALRTLRRDPMLFAVAVVTLALAIGAATTVFGVVDAVILQPLPFAAPDRLVRIAETTPRGDAFSTSEPDFLDFASRNRTLQELAAWRPADMVLTGSGEPRALHAEAVSYNLFPMLGAAPSIGRAFRADEDTPDVPSHVVILSHALWLTILGGDSSRVGGTVTLDGSDFVVIGVMPDGTRFPRADAWIPLRASDRADRTDHWLDLAGRLRPGVTLADAQADFSRIASEIGARYATSAGWGAHVQPLMRSLVDDRFRRAGWVMLAATGLLLLLACANVMHLLLARATARQAELGLRAALGAPRGRLVRQLLIESGVLAAAAALLGVLVAVLGIHAVRRFGGGQMPRLDDVVVDARVIGAALVLGVMTTIACGLAPALGASQAHPGALLGHATRSGGSGRQRRLRDALAVLQLALAIVLLVGASLLLRSVAHLASVDTGYDDHHVLAVTLQLPAPRYDGPHQAAFMRALLERLEGLPGVRAAGATVVDPLSGWNYANDVTPAERVAEAPPTGLLQAGWRSVTPGFFRAMRIPLLGGRAFTWSDGPDAPGVVVVSRTLAEQLWPGEDAVGKRLLWGGTDGTPRTVVGVAQDLRDVRLEAAPAPLVFLPFAQVTMPSLTLAVQATVEPMRIAGPVREAIHAIDPALPVTDPHPMARNRSSALSTPRFALVLSSGFALLGVLLAAGGIHAVVAYNVTRRRREIGIRMAVGATSERVVRTFMRAGLRLVALGILAGLAVSWGGVRLMNGLVFGIAPTDAVTFTAVPLLLGLVAMAATYVPARRAARVAPMEVLRRE